MNWDIVIFIGTFLLALGGMFAAHAYGSIGKLRANWSEYRCHPMYMPFAGMVDPATGTAGNFQHCMGLMGKEVAGHNNDVFGSMMSVVNESVGSLLNPLKLFRMLQARTRKFVLSFAGSSLQKASAPVSMFTYYLNKIHDILRRFVGEGYVAAMFGASAVGFMESFITLVITIIKGFVIAMLVISFILALFQPELFAIVLTIASLLAAAGA